MMLFHPFNSERFCGVWKVQKLFFLKKKLILPPCRQGHHWIFDFLITKSSMWCNLMYGCENQKIYKNFPSPKSPCSLLNKDGTMFVNWMATLHSLLVIAGIWYELLVYPCWLILENPEMSLSEELSEGFSTDVNIQISEKRHNRHLFYPWARNKENQLRRFPPLFNITRPMKVLPM